MKNYIYKILVSLLFVFMSQACSDDFLDTKPIGVESEETFYTNMKAAEMAITTCYSIFNLEKVWDLSIMMVMGSIASDEAEAGGGGKTDVQEYQNIDQLRHTPNEKNVFQWVYGYLFRAIGACNLALEKLPQISEDTDPDYNAALIQRYLGEARFIRALNYFKLTQIFGGVPLVDHVLAQSEYESGRSEIYEIYDLIKSDLHFAINILPEKSELGDDVGRATKGAARALLSKVFLYESSYAKYYTTDDRFDQLEIHWDSAAYWAEQVISSNEYELVGIHGERFNTWRGSNTGGYSYVFLAEANNSSESIFSIQCRNDGLGWFDSRGNSMIYWCMPKYVNTPGAPEQGTATQRWGWWCPTDFLANSYEAGDPRYKATVLEEDDTLLVSSSSGNIWVTPNFKLLEEGTGLHRNQRKYECSPDEVSTTWKEGPTNIKIIRYADVVLFAAEAYLEMEDNTTALSYINMVRERARMSGETNSPAALPSLTHDDIVHERLVELACEGHRFWDLVRWNLADKHLNHTLADGDKIEYIKGKHEFFPLPASEVSLSGGKLEQYSGW